MAWTPSTNIPAKQCAPLWWQGTQYLFWCWGALAEYVITSVIGGSCSSDRGNAGREKANSADLEQPHKLNQPKPPRPGSNPGPLGPRHHTTCYCAGGPARVRPAIKVATAFAISRKFEKSQLDGRTGTEEAVAATDTMKARSHFSVSATPTNHQRKYCLIRWTKKVYLNVIGEFLLQKNQSETFLY